MKKFLVSMMAVITAVLLVACSNASNKDLVHVGVLQYVEHPSLSATRKGFIEELKEEGYVDGKNIKIDYQNAQGDQSNLQTISQSLIEDNDVMLAIAAVSESEKRLAAAQLHAGTFEHGSGEPPPVRKDV